MLLKTQTTIVTQIMMLAIVSSQVKLFDRNDKAGKTDAFRG